MKNKLNQFQLLFPFLLLPTLGLAVAFSTINEVLKNSVDRLLILSLTVVILAFIFIVTYTKRPHTDRDCAATLLFVKAVHLIEGTAIWLSVRVMANVRDIDVSPDFNRWFVLVLCLGGCFGYFYLLCVAKNTRIRTGWVFLVCVLQFVFVLDALSALLLWLRIKKISDEATEAPSVPAPADEEIESVPGVPSIEGAGVESEPAIPGEEIESVLAVPSIESEPAAPAEAGEEIAPAPLPKKKGFHRFRWLLLLPGIYLPYSLLGTLLFLSKLPPLPGNPSPLYDMILVAPFIAAVLCNLIYVITGLNQPDAAEKMTRANMIVLLIQIPGYIINFFFAAVFMLTIFTVAVSLLLSFFNIVCILVTGILGAGMVMGAVKDGKMPVRTAFFTSIFNYIYFVDAVYAIVLFIYLVVRRMSKKFSKRQG